MKTTPQPTLRHRNIATAMALLFLGMVPVALRWLLLC